MRRRYHIYFNANRTTRPYYVYDNVTEKTVGTFSTLEKAKAKYPNSEDYATLLSRMLMEVSA